MCLWIPIVRDNISFILYYYEEYAYMYLEKKHFFL